MFKRKSKEEKLFQKFKKEKKKRLMLDITCHDETDTNKLAFAMDVMPEISIYQSYNIIGNNRMTVMLDYNKATMEFLEKVKKDQLIKEVKAYILTPLWFSHQVSQSMVFQKVGKMC